MDDTDYIINNENNLLLQVSNGLKENEFRLLYQPKFEMKNMKLIGVEALIRWHKSNGKLIYPDYFIPQLEEYEKIYIIDYFVIEACMKKIQQWIREGKKIISIAINVSKSTILRDEFLFKVQHWMKIYEIDSKYIEFEITERECLYDDIQILSEKVDEIKDIGIKVSLDDFGSGSSNILAIANINFNCIKIDKSAIDNIESDKIKNILIGLKNIMDKNKVFILAEGVESHEQYSKLMEYGYSYAQGYYLSKPLSPCELERKYLDT